MKSNSSTGRSRSWPSEHCRAVIDPKNWEPVSIFAVIQQVGNIDQEEMFQVFNMGVGLIIVAPSDEAPMILETIQAQEMTGWVIGEIQSRSSSDAKLCYTT